MALRMQQKRLSPVDPLTGVVLCGGLSSRMGLDKGLLEREGRPWILHSLDLLEPFSKKLILSLNPRQETAYAPVISTLKNIEIAYDEAGAGPLAGFYSVYKKSPQSDILVLACDMQNMRNEILRELVAAYSENPGYDSYLFRGDDGRIEPLCGIYRRGILEKFFGNINQRGAWCEEAGVKDLIFSGNPLFLAIRGDFAGCFRNLNRPEDISSGRFCDNF